RQDENGFEPWTWTRKQGKGKVFYTASGHDTRAWSDAGYQDLIVGGVRFASGRLGEEDLDIPLQAASIPADIVQGGRNLQIPIELSPEESMKRMHTPAGLHVELAISEPEIIKVVC